MSQQTAQKPVKEFRSGALKAAIWQNEREQAGRTVLAHSVRLQKRYRDAQGNWKDTDYLFLDDLPKVRLLVDECYRWIALRESDDTDFPPARP